MPRRTLAINALCIYRYYADQTICSSSMGSLLELGTQLEQEGELAEARRVYRKMVAYNLPGRTLAQSRADRLPVAEQ